MLVLSYAKWACGKGPRLLLVGQCLGPRLIRRAHLLRGRELPGEVLQGEVALVLVAQPHLQEFRG